MIIIISGGATTGIGKTTLGAAIASLLESGGKEVSIVKFDGILTPSENITNRFLYKNNPWIEDEVFCLDDKILDGDIGVYYRSLRKCKSFLSIWQGNELIKLIKNNNLVLTFYDLSKRYVEIIEERIKISDILVLELGGTAGDPEQEYILEAIRILSRKHTIFHIHVSCAPSYNGRNLLKIAKTYANISLKRGISIDLLVLRGENIKYYEKHRIERDTGIEVKNILTLPYINIGNIIKIIKNAPSILALFSELNIKPKNTLIEVFEDLRLKAKYKLNIGLVADTAGWSCYNSIKEAIMHAGIAISTDVNVIVYNDNKELKEVDGIVSTRIIKHNQSTLILDKKHFKDIYLSKPLQPNNMIVKFLEKCRK